MSGEDRIDSQLASDEQIKRAIIHGGSMALQELLGKQSHVGEMVRTRATIAQIREAEASLLTALEVGIAARSQPNQPPNTLPEA